MKLETEKSRGILNHKAGEKKFHLSRHPPSQDLSFFVERYWVVSWDLRGQKPYVQETLPYPCVNLVIEKGAAYVFGVGAGKFSRLLENKGRAFGIKFRPGAFYPFIRSPVSKFTDDSISIRDAFGVDAQALEEAILAREDEGEMREIAENFLRERLPEQDENVREINRIVDYIIAHQEITRVDDIVNRLSLNKRTVQRLFSQYVGVSPKWVIQRYRLHEVAERLAAGEGVDWTKIAFDLGYFDQAHFIKDFKAIVGRTPVEYVKRIMLPER
ncbi:MAG: AraC family transcriptional regulator [Ktedonobacteraceae bacterium]|nr:AraC family transcriptional regulator [Chloroflexota bacterium]